jgi:hypothetical protein
MLSRPEIGTREHVLLWLGSKDPNARYQWEHPERCPCGQYRREHRAEWINQLSVLAEQQPRTWGALYERAYNDLVG